MPQPIARLYGSQATATAAASKLQERGFNAGSIHVISPPAASDPTLPDAAPPADTIIGSITVAGVAPNHAKVYAEGVHRGETLVVVDAPFGHGQTAIAILDSFDPIEVALPEAAAPAASGFSFWRASASSSSSSPGGAENPATPLSNKLGWRVLLDDPAPLSNYMKWRVLKPEPATSPTLEGIRKQSADAAPLSSKIGMAVLSDDPAPLSKRFGWAVLSDDPAPLSKKFGWAVLSDDPAPLSRKLGWRVLSNNPTPLSSWLGWPVLSKR